MGAATGAGVVLFRRAPAPQILLGKMASGWSTLGGSAQRGESPADTAARECHEESRGVLPKRTIRQDVEQALVMRTVTPSGKCFDLFIVEWESQRDDPTQQFAQVDTSGWDCAYQELSELRWFHLDEVLRSNLRGPLRRDLPRVLAFVRRALSRPPTLREGGVQEQGAGPCSE